MREMIMSVLIIVLLMLLSTSVASDLQKPLLFSGDMEEKNVACEMINDKRLTQNCLNFVLTNRLGFGGVGGRRSLRGGVGGHGVGGHSGGGARGGRSQGGGSHIPRGMGAGVLPILGGAAGAAAVNSHHNYRNHRNAAASSTHYQFGFILLRTSFIVVLFLF